MGDELRSVYHGLQDKAVRTALRQRRKAVLVSIGDAWSEGGERTSYVEATSCCK